MVGYIYLDLLAYVFGHIIVPTYLDVVFILFAGCVIGSGGDGKVAIYGVDCYGQCGIFYVGEFLEEAFLQCDVGKTLFIYLDFEF